MAEEIKCEECEYFDKENENCSYLSCDGLDCEDAPCGFRELVEYFGEYDIQDEKVIVNGKAYEYEMNLSQAVPDHKCCRVLIDGNYYYFG